MRAALAPACAAALAGCSNLLGIESLSGPGPADAAIPAADAAAGDAAIAEHIAVRGMVVADMQAQRPFSTTVDLVGTGGTVLATTTSDQAAGRFTLTTQTSGQPFDGAVHIHGNAATGFVEEYIYPPGPLTADYDTGTVFELLGSEIQSLASVFGFNYNPNGTTVIIAQARNAAGAPVAGVRFATSNPNAFIRYSVNAGQSQDSTGSDGRGYLFVPVTPATVNGTVSASGAFTAGPRAVRLLPAAVLLVELRGTPGP